MSRRGTERGLLVRSFNFRADRNPAAFFLRQGSASISRRRSLGRISLCPNSTTSRATKIMAAGRTPPTGGRLQFSDRGRPTTPARSPEEYQQRLAQNLGKSENTSGKFPKRRFHR